MCNFQQNAFEPRLTILVFGWKVSSSGDRGQIWSKEYAHWPTPVSADTLEKFAICKIILHKNVKFNPRVI